MSEPVAGKPYPERWPLRLTVYGGVVHAARASMFQRSHEFRSACGGYFHGVQLRTLGRGMMSKRTRVTCKACRARLAKPISLSEAHVYGRTR
jgi:hypothetical protein